MKNLYASILFLSLFSIASAQQPPNMGGPNGIPNGGGTSGGGAVSSVTGAASCPATVSPTTGAVTVGMNVTARTNTAATDTVVGSDCGNIVFENNATGVAVTLTAPATVGNGFAAYVCNINAGIATLTPASGTIGGASSLPLQAGSAIAPSCVGIQSNGTNYNVVSSGLLPGMNVPSVVGKVSQQTGTTYTFASTDCGTTVQFTNASAITATIPQGLPIGCVIAVEQDGAGKVSVNGSAVTPATLHTHVASSAATGTAGQYAVINLTDIATNTVVLTGDGS